jgi:hypothetical protein
MSAPAIDQRAENWGEICPETGRATQKFHHQKSRKPARSKAGIVQTLFK